MRSFLRLVRYGVPYSFQWGRASSSWLLSARSILFGFFCCSLSLTRCSGQTPRTGLSFWVFPTADGTSTCGRWFRTFRTFRAFCTCTMRGLLWRLAIIAATIAKGVCDYLGTYLVSYAGFGMITDLRNHLYEATLRRSSSFFHKHATGTILSTLINDVDRVQLALSSVIGEFLQQFFTFLVGIIFVIRLGGHLSWALVLFIPVVITSARKIGREVRTRTRTGQDKLAEIQNILHETVTGNRIVKAFNTEIWEILRFKRAAKRLLRANLRNVRIQSISSPLMDTIGAIAIALFLLIGRDEIQHGRMTMGLFGAFIYSAVQALRSGAQICVLLQQLPAGDGRFGFDIRFLRCQG